MTLLTAACGSTDLGGALGDILGSSTSTQSSDVRGTVDTVDANNQRISIDSQYVNNLRDTRADQWVYYDSNTRVVFEGRDYNVSDLERGDEISIRGANTGGRYVAETIEVTRDATR
ncbi:MAG TPA: hypothetical protein VF618_10695 [Thermoanaerobaculia bacterium]